MIIVKREPIHHYRFEENIWRWDAFIEIFLGKNSRFRHKRAPWRNPRGFDMINGNRWLLGWCRRRESNSHGHKARGILSPVRLPISPLRHFTAEKKDVEIFFYNQSGN
jgi:hypothetical protein